MLQTDFERGFGLQRYASRHHMPTRLPLKAVNDFDVSLLPFGWISSLGI